MVADQRTVASTLTLGELLYANPAVARVTENEWFAVVNAIAAGEREALRWLYDKTCPLVISYLLQLTHDRRAVEGLIVDVYESVWRGASVFDRAGDGPVIGWVMKQARSAALAYAPVGTMQSGVRSELWKLRQQLQIRGEKQ